MITVHPVKLEEILEVKQLLSYTWSCTYGEFLSPKTIEKVTSVWHSPENLKAQTQDPSVYFAVAKDSNGKIVGLVTARAIDNSIIVVYRLYVHPASQRQGIGTLLLSAAIKHFPNRKIVKLEVEELNKKAINFYKKQGFKEVERKQENIEGETLNTIVMEKDFTTN